MAALTVAVAAAAVGQQQSDSTAGAGRQFHNWKMKAEQDKKVEFIRTAEKLKTELANTEKGKTGHFYNRKSSIRAEYSILEELERSMTVSREAEKAKILQHLSKIQSNVKRLQQQLQAVKPTPEGRMRKCSWKLVFSKFPTKISERSTKWPTTTGN